MFYREAGQFKPTYADDSAIFPLRQDRIGIAIILALAFVVVPLIATPYVFSAILIPSLILALAAIGLNILTGYAGQLSLGTAANAITSIAPTATRSCRIGKIWLSASYVVLNCPASL